MNTKNRLPSDYAPTRQNTAGWPAFARFAWLWLLALCLWLPAGSATAAETVVANYGGNSLAIVNLATGDRTLLVTTNEAGVNLLSGPVGVAREANGNLIIGEDGGSRLIRINPATGLQTILSSSSVGAGPAMSSIYGLAVDAGGHIIVASFGNQNILRVDPVTGDRTVLASSSVGSGVAMETPFGVMVDTGGTILFPSWDGTAILRLDPTTMVRTHLSSSSSVGSGPSLSRPTAVLRLPDGDYAALNNYETNYVLRIDPATGDRTLISGTTQGDGPAIGSRYSMALADDGNLYVADFDNNRIVRVDVATGDRTVVSGVGVGDGPAFSYPLGMLGGAVSSIIPTSGVMDLAGNELAGTPFTSGETYIYQTNSAPTAIQLSSATVNQSGGEDAAVGTLSTTDSDTSDSHTYTLVAGSGDTDNASFIVETNTLKVGATALATGGYSVRIQTDDGNGGTYEEAFAITVLDDIAPVITSAESASGTYGQVFSYTIAASGGATVFGATGLPSGLAVDVNTGEIPGTPTAVGSFTVEITAADVAGNTDTNSLALTIGQAEAAVTLASLEHVYDGRGKAATATTVPEGLTVLLSYDGSAVLPTNAGSYEVIGTVADANYAGAATNTLVIAQAEATVTLAGLSHIFDGTGKAATATTTPADLTVNLTYAGSATLPTNAGSYEVIGTVADVNYAGAATNTLAIVKASATVSLAGLDQTYDGTARTLMASTTPQGLMVDLAYNGSRNAPTNAGSYEVVGTINGTNFAGSSTNTLAVQPAPLSVTTDNASRKYGEANPVFAGTMLGAVTGDNVTATYATTATPTSPAGTYPITPTVVDPNHKLPNYALTLTNGILTVTMDDPPIVTLTTNLAIYTENAEPVRLDLGATVTDGGSLDFDGGTLTVTLTTNAEATDLLGVRNQGPGVGEIGANTNEVSFGGVVFGSLAGGTGTNALIFAFNTNATPVAMSALLQNLTFASTSEWPSTNARLAEFVVTDGDGGTSAPVSLTLEVVAVRDEPVLTWTNPESIIYGTSLGGTQLGATASVPGTHAYDPPQGAILNAGTNQTLTVVFTPDDLVNYTMATGQVSITVLKAALTTTADGKTRGYGAANPALTISYTGFVNADTAAAIDTPPTAGTTATTDSSVGAYPITLAGGGDDNYTLSLVNGTLTITTVPLLLVINDAARLYGEMNPTFTGTILQTRNSDTFNASYSTTATASSPEGSYPITGTVLDKDAKLGNYTITVTDGTLTVGKTLLTATANNLSRAYGATNPMLTVSYSGFANGDTSAVLDSAPAASTTAEVSSPLGSYPITLSGGSDVRYTIVLANGTLTVGKAPLTITAESLTKPYGATNPTLTLSYAGLVNGDTSASLDAVPTVATAAVTESVAGIYPITLTGGSDARYDIALANGTLTVTPDDEFGIVLLTSPTTYLRRKPPVKLDAGATLNPGGRAHFGGGQLTATIVSNALAGDLLAAFHQGTDASLIGLVGDDMFIEGTLFAQMIRAENPVDPLIFNLNSNATPAAIQSLVRELSFVTTNVDTRSRVVELVLTDGEGDESFPARKVIAIDRIKDDSGAGGITNLAALPRGIFNGLILRTNDILPERSGRFQLTVKDSLNYSGYFVVGAQRTAFSGRFNAAGHSALLLRQGAWAIQLELVPETDIVRGTVTSYRGGGWSSDLFGYRAGYSRTNHAVGLAGTYTMRLPGSTDPNVATAGNGYAALTVDLHGKVSLSGALADGQVLLQNTLVASNGDWPVYLSLDRQQGVLIGWLKFASPTNSEPTGTLTWIKARRAFFPNGFAAELDVIGSRYTPPASTAPLLTWNEGLLSASGGNLIEAATNQFTLSNLGELMENDGPLTRVTLNLTRKNGVFRGQFYHPVGRRVVKYSGVVLQNLDYGAGYFLGLDQGGLIRLESTR